MVFDADLGQEGPACKQHQPLPTRPHCDHTQSFLNRSTRTPNRSSSSYLQAQPLRLSFPFPSRWTWNSTRSEYSTFRPKCGNCKQQIFILNHLVLLHQRTVEMERTLTVHVLSIHLGLRIHFLAPLSATNSPGTLFFSEFLIQYIFSVGVALVEY